MSLFPDSQPPKPLPENMRPTTFEHVLGQPSALRLLNAYLQEGNMPHVVFWGPPGTGKTTLSRLMAAFLEWDSRFLNATSASVKDIRVLAAEAKVTWNNQKRQTLVFIDEIHRLNKAQQDVLLPILEAGTFTLAGSTTENPFFALNQALRSRVQLVRLEPLAAEAVLQGLERAVKTLAAEAETEALEWIATRCGGDLRLALTVLESAHLFAKSEERPIETADARLCLRQTQIAGDRKGDNHYDLASAFQKSLRGSDENAAVYYLARFLESGEDPLFIARRLLVTASEDVGNADPQAFVLASAAFRAVEVLGLPEARIPLAQATLYVARAPKSNLAIAALGAASGYLKQHPLAPIPAHLRDAHYKGAAELGHGKGYIYTHNHPKESQFFLPDKVIGQQFVTPTKPEEPEPVRLDPRPLLAFLNDHYGASDWFEIKPKWIAEQLNWREQDVRAVLNQLVQQKSLHYRRTFKLAQNNQQQNEE